MKGSRRCSWLATLLALTTSLVLVSCATSDSGSPPQLVAAATTPDAGGDTAESSQQPMTVRTDLSSAATTSTTARSTPTSPTAPDASTFIAGPIRIAGPMDGSLTALIPATLEVAGGCVGFRNAAAGEFTVVVWPSGSSWSDADATVVVAGGGRARIGDLVSLGGGHMSIVDLAQLGDFGAGLQQAVETCGDTSGGTWLAGFVNAPA